MSSSNRRNSHHDDDDSLDDLDSTLDKALNNASNSIFNNSRHSSQGSVGAIPLTSFNNGASSPGGYLGGNISRSYNHSHEYPQNDSSPLINGHHSRSFSSTSSLSISLSQNSRSIKFTVKRKIRNLIKFFRLAKFELNQERHKSNVDHEYNEDRFISPRNHRSSSKYPTNAISNAKYNPITFIPIILYEQFKFFFNLYFLLVALSQIVPKLRIGYLSSYIVPLAFVLTVTMMKEAGDDISRRRRDVELNNELYEVLNRANGPNNLTPDVKMIAAKHLRVGDVIRIHKGKKIPADMILLQSSDKDNSGEAFIKTDQLDGETDWKLRIALNITQSIHNIDDLINRFSLIINKPIKSIHNFNGRLIHHPQGYDNSSSFDNETYPLSIDQTMWANTVLASGSAIGMIVYTGVETRQQLNTTKTGVKTGLLELEINRLSKILCVSVFLLSAFLVGAKGWPLPSTWYIDVLRYLILFSTIIPVSLRVNLDLAKSVYAYQIHHDREIESTVVRTSTIPEDLGRIEYLLSDKTGTLTQNDMELKKLHLGSVSYAGDTMDMVTDYVDNLVVNYNKSNANVIGHGSKKKDLSSKVYDLVLTLALCHNVTPTYDEDDYDNNVTYQAASPDEIAIVKFTESVGLKLIQRDRHSMTLLHLRLNQQFKFEILYIFPFNSESKRMGVVVKDVTQDEIVFLQKGADTVMIDIVSHNDWLEEETGNMAREGLRTLVIGKKKLNPKLFSEFERNYLEANMSMRDRDMLTQKAISHYLEQDLELLGLTGVEDKLQRNVKLSIELLRNAGIKIWMLTGDKIETAKCVSISCKLIARGQFIHQITKVNHPDIALNQLEVLKLNQNSVLLIDGDSLSTYMKFLPEEFFEIVLRLPAVVACRCSPQQKADIAQSIKDITGKRICCIGDGGNDVSMIQCANVGVGIVGKEGKQASLAADFSIDQFYYLCKLLLWHGRNSYKRSSKLGQFVMHRGLIISVCQAVYSIASNFEPLALYKGFLMVGYSTIYTMMPVFSLTLDCDVNENLTKLYPELYKELTLGKSLSYKRFFVWCLVSFYQGCIIQLLTQKFQGLDIHFFQTMVSLSFSCLVFNELIMVCLQVNQWNKVMIITLILTFLIYISSIPMIADEYFDLEYMLSFEFIWQCGFILLLSLFPIWLIHAINRKLRPPSYAKVQQD